MGGMGRTLGKTHWTLFLAGFTLAVGAVGADVGLGSPQSTALRTPDNGTPGERAPLVLVEAVAPLRLDADGEHAVARLARRSSQEAWRAALALPESPWRERLLRFVAARWLGLAPSEALGAFEAMDEARLPAKWTFEMLARWMAVDEEAASDWAAATTGGRARVLMAGAINWLLDHAQPREAVLASVERMLRRWARSVPAAAWDVASADGLVGLVGQREDLLRAVVEVWLARDPRSALDAATALRAWQVLHSWIADVAAEWARAAPREAADWVLTVSQSSRDVRLLAAIHAPLSVVAPDEALAFAGKLGAGEAQAAYRQRLYEQQLRELLGDDPRVLAQWLARQPDEHLRISQAGWIAGLFLEISPDDALEWALRLPAKESEEALKVVIPAIAEQDPARAKGIALSVPEAVAPPRRGADGEHPVVRMARSFPREAWRAALALPESRWRERLRRFVAVRWVERTPSEALGAFEAMDEERMPAEWMFEMLARWMAVDDESASDWAAATTAGRSRVLMAGAIDWLLDHARPREVALASAERMLRRWARRDPAAAWDAASADGLVWQRKVLLRGVAEVWLARDPRRALDTAMGHRAWQVMRSEWIVDVVAEWARAAPREAADWVLTVPQPSRDERLLAAIHAPLSVAAPDEALAFVGKLGDGEAYAAYSRTRWYRQQLRELLGDDPRVLAKWLARQPDENLRIGEAGWIARLFLETSPDDALEWTLGLPAKESGNALEVVVGAIAEQDPARAEAIVLGVSEPDAQVDAAGSLLHDWALRRRQPAAAYQWAVENLSAAVRQGVNAEFFWGWAITDPADALSALDGVADVDHRVAAYTLQGMVWGIGWDETPERLRERMVALDRLYQDLMRIAPEPLGSDGDLPSYKLYHYWKEIDPVRAAKYKERAERYDGPTQ